MRYASGSSPRPHGNILFTNSHEVEKSGYRPLMGDLPSVTQLNKKRIRVDSCGKIPRLGPAAALHTDGVRCRLTIRTRVTVHHLRTLQRSYPPWAFGRAYLLAHRSRRKSFAATRETTRHERADRRGFRSGQIPVPRLSFETPSRPMSGRGGGGGTSRRIHRQQNKRRPARREAQERKMPGSPAPRPKPARTPPHRPS